MITGGTVFLNGQKAISPAQLANPDAAIQIRGTNAYVGRGAYKLEGALEKFGINVAGMTCADIGAATGGFTEVLLRRGAARVYAIDTAHGKMAMKIREDPRVTVMERTDVRTLASLPEKMDCVVIDVSLISLRDILPHAARLLSPDGIVVALFKPQYETRDPAMLRHGIIRDHEKRENLAADFQQWLTAHKWSIMGRMESPIKGSEGNTEYLFYLAHKK